MNLRFTITRIIIVTFCLSMLQSCAARNGVPLTRDQKLTQFVSAADKVADTVLIVQKAAMDAETAGTLPRNPTRIIMEATRRILVANNSAMNIVRDLSRINEPTRAELLTILAPVIREINSIVTDTNITGIQNQAVKTTITTSLATIQAALNSINLLISATTSNLGGRLYDGGIATNGVGFGYLQQIVWTGRADHRGGQATGRDRDVFGRCHRSCDKERRYRNPDSRRLS